MQVTERRPSPISVAASSTATVVTTQGARQVAVAQSRHQPATAAVATCEADGAQDQAVYPEVEGTSELQQQHVIAESVASITTRHR